MLKSCAGFKSEKFYAGYQSEKCKIISSDVNRPALQLTGYFEHFEESRIQMIGNVEYTFIQQMSDAEKKTRYDAFLKFDIPCVIFCRNLQPDEIFLEEAIKMKCRFLVRTVRLLNLWQS